MTKGIALTALNEFAFRHYPGPEQHHKTWFWFCDLNCFCKMPLFGSKTMMLPIIMTESSRFFWSPLRSSFTNLDATKHSSRIYKMCWDPMAGMIRNGLLLLENVKLNNVNGQNDGGPVCSGWKIDLRQVVHVFIWFEQWRNVWLGGNEVTRKPNASNVLVVLEQVV